MIEINRHNLPNGLKLLHHFDPTTQMVALNILYDVGSKDENPDHTGFAHLFEHLMFGGSQNIPDFDGPLQEAGGENNAWTSNDITNYYSVVPRQNAEVAFWLESDRMNSLDFSEKSLAVQKQVVIEEFKQRLLNQPYGDISLLIRPEAYRVHPYRWSTIGKEIAHIEKTTLSDVKEFFFTHYAPNNAILAVSGNISFDETCRLTEKWFGPIERRSVPKRALPQEPLQTQPRQLEVERPVPLGCVVKAYHMSGRLDERYHSYDLLSDLLANGRSARLYQHLIMEQKLFTDVNAYITGDIEPGLFFVKGSPVAGVSLEEADRILTRELQQLAEQPVEAYELTKVINKFESNDLFSNINYLNKATNMAYYELLNRAEDINCEVEKYLRVTPEMLCRTAAETFVDRNCTTLLYHSNASAALSGKK